MYIKTFKNVKAGHTFLDACQFGQMRYIGNLRRTRIVACLDATAGVHMLIRYLER